MTAFLYMTVFKRKHYFLLVFMNAIGIIFESFNAAISFICMEQENENVLSPLRKFLFNGSVGFFDILWGAYENSNDFMLVFMLPAILAMKSRETYELTMAGSILGISVCLSFCLGQLIFVMIRIVKDD